MAKQTQFDRALKFVQKKHQGQFRADKVPVWRHLTRVSKTLDHALSQAKEGTASERALIYTSALGHDLLEDTNATEREIEHIFGAKGLSLIKGMTNKDGDKNVSRYVEHMAHAPEEVRLIKLADMYDNVTGVTYNLKTLGLKWTNGYFLPIVIPMRGVILKTNFRKYKKTAAILKTMVKAAFSLLEDEIKRS